MTKSVALFDMDGTLCDYVNAMLRDLEKLRAPGEEFVDPFIFREDPTYQYLWNRMDLIKSSVEWWANLPRFELGFDILNMAQDLDYECEILTQIPKVNSTVRGAALDGKQRWIAQHLGENIDYTMTRDKSKHYGRVLVDDFPGYIIPWLKHRKHGLVIMPANDYNSSYSDSRVIRYDGSNKEEVYSGFVRSLKA